MLEIQIPALLTSSNTMWKTTHESPDSKSETSTDPSKAERVSRTTAITNVTGRSGISAAATPTINGVTYSSILANSRLSQNMTYQVSDIHDIAHLSNNSLSSQLYTQESSQHHQGGGTQHQIMTSSLNPNIFMTPSIGSSRDAATNLQPNNASGAMNAVERTGDGDGTSRIVELNNAGLLDVTTTSNGDTEGSNARNRDIFEQQASDRSGAGNGLLSTSEEAPVGTQQREYFLNNYLSTSTSTSATSQLSQRFLKDDNGSKIAANLEEFARRQSASMNTRRELQLLLQQSSASSITCRPSSDNNNDNATISSGTSFSGRGGSGSTEIAASAPAEATASLPQLENCAAGATTSLVRMKRGIPSDDDRSDTSRRRIDWSNSQYQNYGAPVSSASLTQTGQVGVPNGIMDTFVSSAGQAFGGIHCSNSSASEHQNKMSRTDSSGGKHHIPPNSPGISVATPPSPHLQISPVVAGSLVLPNVPFVRSPHGDLVAPPATVINHQYLNQLLLSQQPRIFPPRVLLPPGLANNGAAALHHQGFNPHGNGLRILGRSGQFLVATTAPSGTVSSANISFPPSSSNMQQQLQSIISASPLSGRSSSTDLSTTNPIQQGDNINQHKQEQPPRPVEAPSSNSNSRTIIHEGRTRDDNILTLKTPSDIIWLSQFLCFLREECCEVFKASEQDVKERRKSKQIKLNQVGIRCRFCSHLPHTERTGRSSCFPSSIDRIYQSVTMMIREHFSICEEFPQEIRKKYVTLKQNTRKGEMESKTHWGNAAREIGMIDGADSDESGETKKGIFFKDEL